MSVQELEINYNQFLDKTTLLFGESGTGKSFVMVDILYQLQPHVEQIIVISPTDRNNHTYDGGLVPLPCIHYEITKQLLINIWERQTALAAVYSRANKLETLRQLYAMIPNDSSAGIIESIHKKLRDFKNEITQTDPSTAGSKIADMENECRRLVTMIWKDAINKHRGRLQRLALTEDQKYSLNYLNLNPRLVLIFDDCTEQLKKFKTDPVIQKLFYQGRHVYITALIACHTDKALDPELKKNAYVSFFTEETCARCYFMKDSTSLDKEGKKRADDALKTAFTPLAKHQKLVWIRNDKNFYKYTASAHSGFRFGSQYIWDFCNRIKVDGSTMAPGNKFMGEFS
jgi:hypothetical protein